MDIKTDSSKNTLNIHTFSFDLFTLLNDFVKFKKKTICNDYKIY